MTVKILILFVVILSFCYGSIFVDAAQHFKQRNLKQKVKPPVEPLLDYDYEDYNYIDDVPNKQTVIDRGMQKKFFIYLKIETTLQK